VVANVSTSVRTIPRQGVRVSGVGVEVDAALCSHYFPLPDHSFIIGKESAFAPDHLLHQQGSLGFVGSKASNLAEVPMIMEHIREDDGIPCRVRDPQCITDSLFNCLARQILQ
jgi:hypothetical protein